MFSPADEVETIPEDEEDEFCSELSEEDEESQLEADDTASTTPEKSNNKKYQSKLGSQMKQIKDLRDLYKRVNSRLSWAQGIGDNRLKKEEHKIVTFLEDEMEEKKELKVFEKIEKYTGRPSFGSRASIVEQFMNDKMCLDTTHSEIGTEIDIESVFAGSQVSEVEKSPEKYSNSSGDEEDEIESNNGSINQNEDDGPSRPNSPQLRDDSIEKLAELMKKELNTIKLLSEKVENSEFDMEKERKAFEKYKQEETAKLDSKRKIAGKDSQNFIKMRGENETLRKSNLEFESKMQKLQEQIKSINMEWGKRSNRWNLTRKKLEDKNQELEKLCKELEAENQKMKSWQASSNKGKNTSGIIKQGLKLKRIQFVESDAKIKPKVNNTQSSSCNTAAPGYFGLSTNNQKEPPKKALPLRSSLKQSFTTSPEISPNHNYMSTDENLDPRKLVQAMPDTSQELDLSSSKGAEGDIEKVFPNGTRKLISTARNFTRTLYKNGDIKEKRSDGSIHYFFAEFGLRHYVYPNGLEMTSYANGQIERKNPDGSVEILYPNGCVKFIRSDGKEECIFPDNTVYQTDEQGYTVILLPTGQKEIQTDLWKKRIFPDGTTKTVFNDGATETHYPNGRIRIKNSTGQLLSDTCSSSDIITQEESNIDL